MKEDELRMNEQEKGYTWLQKPGIAFFVALLYGSNHMSVMFAYCLIGNYF